MIKLIDILEEIQQEHQMKEGWKDIALGTAMTAASLLGTGGDVKAQTTPPQQQPSIEKTTTSPELQIKKLLTSSKYGWKRSDGRIYYIFLKDGRLLIFGSKGESEMFRGKWILKGDKLTLINNEFNDVVNADKVFATKILPIKIVGNDLIIGNQTFKRDF